MDCAVASEMVSYIYELTTKFHSQSTHTQSGDTLGQETFLAPSADNKTGKHDRECSNN